jgi:tetratricopeptide (TPR) repeat protein
MNQQIKDFYRELDLEPGDDLVSVRESYRQLVKVWHPDRFTHDHKLQTMANDKLRRIILAYEALLAFFEAEGIAQSSSPPKAEAPAGSDWLEEVIKMSRNDRPPKTPRAAHGSNIYHAGLSRYRARDYKAALRLFLQAAEMGNASAQYGVGYVYYRHRKFIPLVGAGKHFADILRWWTKAAEQGHADAQYMVGIFHQIGWSTPFDEAEARKWFQRAGEQGHVHARLRLRDLGIVNKIQNGVPLLKIMMGDTPPAPPPPK